MESDAATYVGASFPVTGVLIVPFGESASRDSGHFLPSSHNSSP